MNKRDSDKTKNTNGSPSTAMETHIATLTRTRPGCNQMAAWGQPAPPVQAIPKPRDATKSSPTPDALMPYARAKSLRPDREHLALKQSHKHGSDGS
jgi:hypothetical protein